jgi:UDP-glucose 4-epimerase
MKKLLVIGASGSLGNGFVDSYSSKYEIIGTYNSNRITRNDITSIKLDITNKSDFEKIPENIDTILLFSAAMPAEMKGYDRQRYIDVNITGTLNTLEFCRKRKIKKIIYIMTFSDVADSFYTGEPIKESQPRALNYVGDHAVYSISKVAACELLEHYHQQYGLQTILFRIPTVYCCDDKVDYYVDGELKTKAYIKMIRSVVSNKSLELWGNVNHSKDMPYIKDFSRLINQAIEHKTAQGLYNAGTGNPVTLQDFSAAIIKVFGEGHEINITYLPEKSSQPNFTFDMSKTQTTFNYKCEYGIEDMLYDIKENVDPTLFRTIV